MNRFLKTDLDFLNQMVHFVNPNNQQINMIWELYKEYNMPGARYPIMGNCNCGHSVQDYFSWLRTFRSENAHKFVNPIEPVFKPINSYKRQK
jgi:hypothetical protein